MYSGYVWVTLVTKCSELCESYICLTYLAGAIYTSESNGNDETGDGSESKPFKTALKV